MLGKIRLLPQYNSLPISSSKASLAPMCHRPIAVLLFLFCFCAAATFAVSQQPAPSSVPATTQAPYLYKASLVQAAPGKLLDLIELYKSQAAGLKAAGDETPLWMRHSQGDHWDLMILWPMGSYSEYYQPERVARREQTEKASRLHARIRENIAWQEDLFAYGPPLADLRKAFAGGAFFHVEMFVSLPGKFGDLYREREMENAYSKSLKQPENFIFVRDQGAAWDIFTIGVFRDLKHYAESADALPKDQEAAAKAAGFEAPSQIGPYLRQFIREHHDTLAVAIKYKQLAYSLAIAFSTSSAVRGRSWLSMISLPSWPTANISSMRTPSFSSGI